MARAWKWLNQCPCSLPEMQIGSGIAPTTWPTSPCRFCGSGRPPQNFGSMQKRAKRPGQVQGVRVAAQTTPADQALNLMTLVRCHGALAAFGFARGLVGADPARARIVERLAKATVGIIAIVVAVEWRCVAAR